MSNKPVTPHLVELAAITGAHGVTGEVRLKLFGEGVDALTQFKQFNEGALTLKKVRSDNKGGAIARFAEVTNRGEAEKLRGTVLSVAREDMPCLEEGEYYHADLIGMSVEDEHGKPFGTVIAIQNFGAGDVIEIKDSSGASQYLPFTRQSVPIVDLKAKNIVVAAQAEES